MLDSGLRTVIFIYFITHLFYRQFLAVSNSKRIFKISQQLMKLSQKVRHHFFLRQCIGNSTWAERSPAPSASVPYLKLPRHSPGIAKLYCDVLYPAKMQIFSQVLKFYLVISTNLGGTWRRICSPLIRSISALEVFNRSLYKSTLTFLSYVLTYLLHGRYTKVLHLQTLLRNIFLTFVALPIYEKFVDPPITQKRKQYSFSRYHGLVSSWLYLWTETRH